MLLLSAGFSIPRGPLELTPELLPTQDASLPPLYVVWGLGSRLSLFHFQGPNPR